jgi:hypothetical protein
MDNPEGNNNPKKRNSITIQDVINICIAFAALIVAILTYQDRDAINRLTDISNGQTLQLHAVDSSLNLLDSQLIDLGIEVDLLKNQNGISKGQDKKLLGILVKLDLQYQNLSAQLALNRKSTDFANKIEFFKRKAETSRLQIFYNEITRAEKLIADTSNVDTATVRRYLTDLKPAYEKGLQNTVLLENQNLTNYLFELSDFNDIMTWMLGKTLNDKFIVWGIVNGKNTKLTTQEQFAEYNKWIFSLHLNQEMKFRDSLKSYVGRIQENLINEQELLKY